ncbi:MAG TPA: prepilin-type N-terminal cleavage/methylation domain-containing protein [Candidatus Eisenbacteria bacterium]|jgi:prepilin-type N-terminal cleavage/methylation domain-containing protein|nr:prepilin-type N-terminal cleavage/methylation domain-containing protein [Candidatus Eisenbacteria bacterium]
MERGTKGFTLIELSVALLVVAIVGAISITGYVSIVRSTHAMQAVGDLYAVRAAAYMNYGDTSKWPADLSPGIPPAELASRLPAGFEFVRRDYRLDWDNWIGQPFAPGDPRSTVVVGVSVVSNDPKLLDTIQSLMTRTYVVRTSPTKATLRIIGPGGL